MNFEEIDKILEGISDEEVSDPARDTAEFTLTASAELADKYGETAYAIPFSFINWALIAQQLRDENHEAIIKKRVHRFEAFEFPELQYGETEDQPDLATVFAEYMNLSYSAVLYHLVAELQEEESIEITFDGEKMVYSLTDETLIEDEMHEVMIEYANIFL